MELLPKTAYTYDEYWNSLGVFNQWFIKLRWAAVAFLTLYWAGLRFIPAFNITRIQSTAIFSTAIFIAAYNYMFINLFRTTIKNNRYKLLVFSLMQIGIDLVALSVLVYFSGGVESPIITFYIFHIIIGSLILPSNVMYTTATILILILSLFSSLEYYGIIPHQSIQGLLPHAMYKNPEYVISVLAIFFISLIISVMLTNKIAGELYGREGQLKKALDELSDSEKSKQRFILSIVHDLKMPLDASLSQLEPVLGDIIKDVGDSVKDRIRSVKERLIDAIEIINNILRISNYKLFNKINLEEGLIEPVISKILTAILPVANQKEIVLKFINNEPNDVHLKWDKVLMNLVLSNLINNSIKFTGAKGVVEITCGDQDGFRTIEIVDDGIGLPSKDKGKIFNDFNNVYDSNKIEGYGLEFPIIKQIIENHHGSLEIKSPSRLAEANRPGIELKISLPLNNHST